MIEKITAFEKVYPSISGIKVLNGSSFISKYTKNSNTSEYKNVNFIDYDGTVLYSYTTAQFSALETLPPNPIHRGLIAQGWNWTKQQISSYLTATPEQKIFVGQMYTTSSGNAEIDITLDDPNFLSPYLSITVNGEVSVNWGDGSSATTITGSSLTSVKENQHIYSQIGDYTISISVVSGSFAFYAASSAYSGPLRFSTSGSDDMKKNNIYANTITAIRIGNNVEIRQYAFQKCKFLKSITMPSSITSLGSGAFYYCYSLASATIPSGVTSISSNTFNECYSIMSIAIPSGVTSIGDGTFKSCYSLTSVVVPSGVTSIGEGTFNFCYSLKSITIPSGVTSIKANTFSYCLSLVSVVLPSGVTSIGSYAFENCYSLESITMPSSVTSIGNYAFVGCGVLKRITIPSGVTSIGTQTFKNCNRIESITVPSSVTSIGANAFEGCFILKSITIPSGVTTIPSTAFKSCYSLTSATIPSGVTSIGASAFYYGQSLTSMTIPASVTSIGDYAFRYCFSVTEYHLLPTTPPTLGNLVFDNIASDCIIYVPKGKLSDYQGATNWSTYASYMREEP